jgi:hypothetical protein
MIHVPAKLADKDVVDSVYGRVVLKPCPTCNGIDQRLPWLREMSGLHAGELDMRLTDYWAKTHGPIALNAVRYVLDNHGWATLHGEFDTGKTFLLMAAVNDGIQSGRLSIYLPLSRLLDHLRQAYRPDKEAEHDGLWDNLLRADVLALDECDKFSSTAWAEERLNMLIDYRYRDWNAGATLFAVNELNALPGYLRSRMMDHRFRQVATKGHVRPGLERT